MRKILNTKMRVPFFVAIFAFLAYLPALQNGFITNWDDDHYVYQNPFIRSFDLRLLRSAFCGFHAENWHPLTWLSHALDYALWGLNPMGHHLTSVIVHALNTFLVAYLVMLLMEHVKGREEQASASRSITHDRAAGVVGAVSGLLFGLHPLHVESVAWVAERKDVLCALFFLAAIVQYAGYVRGTTEDAQPFRNKHYLLALGFFVLALMSKPMAVTLPFVLLILDWYPFGRIRSPRTFWNACVRKFPFFLLSFGSSILTILAQRAGGTMRTIEEMPVVPRLLVAGKALIAYLVKMIVPLDLVPYYPYPKTVSLFALDYAVPVLLAAGITIASIAGRRRYPLVAAAWWYYVITLVPVLGIVQVGNQAMADRYTYLPSLGPILLLGVLAGKVYEGAWAGPGRGPARRGSILAVALALLVSFSYATWKQIAVWRDGVVFWGHVIQQEPARTDRAHTNLGNAYAEKGLMDQAIEQYRIVLRLMPDDATTLSNLGNAYATTGQLDQAIEMYRRTLQLAPDDARTYSNLGNAYASKGFPDRAIEQYERAVRLKPDFAGAYYNLGNAYFSAGRLDRAIEHYRRALDLEKDYRDAHQNLGTAYLSKGLVDLAIEQYRFVARLQPDDAAAHFNLGVAYAAKGLPDLAIRSYRTAVQLQPDFAEAHINLGFLYLNAGAVEQARREFEIGSRLRPDNERARQVLDALTTR